VPSRGRLRWALAGGAAALALALLLAGGRADADKPSAGPAAPPPPGLPFFAAVPVRAPAPEEGAARVAQLVEQVREAEHTLCDYRASTVYPHASRPSREEPDQLYPNRPVLETNAMRLAGGGSDKAIQIQSAQSRVFMAAGEQAEFSLRALDAGGNVLPLVVTRAQAQGLTFNGRAGQQVTLAFADDGTGADLAAGDGTWSAALAPARGALATFNGTIRTIVNYSVNGRAGALALDVIYSPEVPAVWSGAPREASENGSLVYILKLDVRTAGRYVISGRVDDAHGKPFALASFNELLPAGPNEIRLPVFGKLLRDQAPAMPLTLRDVDGYLLKENTDPDRALLPRLSGPVLAGRARSPAAFSDAEWQSEERSRHLTEFGKDVDLARAALAEADPQAAAALPGGCKTGPGGGTTLQ
jgi:hypothetical protein